MTLLFALWRRRNRYGGEEEYWVSVRETGSREQEDTNEERRTHVCEDRLRAPQVLLYEGLHCSHKCGFHSFTRCFIKKYMICGVLDSIGAQLFEHICKPQTLHMVHT